MKASAILLGFGPREPRETSARLHYTVPYSKASMDGGYPGNNRDARPFISGMRRV